MVGGLGTSAVLGTLALANIWNPGGWVMGALAGLSAIAGGSVGSLIGGGAWLTLRNRKRAPGQE